MVVRSPYAAKNDHAERLAFADDPPAHSLPFLEQHRHPAFLRHGVERANLDRSTRSRTLDSLDYVNLSLDCWFIQTIAAGRSHGFSHFGRYRRAGGDYSVRPSQSRLRLSLRQRRDAADMFEQHRLTAFVPTNNLSAGAAFNPAYSTANASADRHAVLLTAASRKSIHWAIRMADHLSVRIGQWHQSETLMPERRPVHRQVD